MNLHFTRRTFVRLITACAGALGLARSRVLGLPAPSTPAADDATNPDTMIWFAQPASQWQDALPLGNGRLGAMVFGGVTAERIGLNEDTLWSGAPREWNNPDAKAHLPIVRKLVLEDGNYQAATRECSKMQGPWNQAYEPLGDLQIEMEHAAGATGYRRSLDLDSALSAVAYEVAGIHYGRKVFASFPDDVIVVRLTASRPASLTCSVRLTSLLKARSLAEGATLVLSGKAPSQSLPAYVDSAEPVQYSDMAGAGMHFAAALHLLADGVIRARPDGSLHVQGASSITITLGCATGYRGFAANPDLPASDVLAAANMVAMRAAAMPYEQLLHRHREDHQKLFRRVSLELPATENTRLATDQRVAAFAGAPDPALLALYFHYGRYLMIASSRPGTQPANLQGIWNAEVRPPWSSNWTANINVQMNYWLAETCNLSECHLPLIAMVQDLSSNGARTAAVNYGARGWVSHHNIDLWRQSSPVGEGQPWVSPTWANFAMSGAWLCEHLWEHYSFTGDEMYLRQTAYPVMRGAAEFCLDWLIEDGKGALTTCPSVSTENVFIAPDGQPADVSAGCTMDLAQIRELFANCSAGAAILGVDADFSAKLEAACKRLAPYKVGSFGQLQEWSLDFEEKFPGMRHMSHLYPLYPGNQITPRSTPELALAARRSLERRLQFAGSDNSPFTGWARAWAIALWARLENGEMAWDSLKTLINHSINGNLFDDVDDTHPAAGPAISTAAPRFTFQIDANFGGAAAIAEMLLQSHAGEIAFLPALPAAWDRGKVKGLRARGGIEAEIAWTSAHTSTATIRATAGSTYHFRAPHRQKLQGITRRSGEKEENFPLPAGDRQTFALTARSGDTYSFTFISA